MPAEIRLIIIEQFLDVKSITNLAVSGPIHYTLIAKYEHKIAAKTFMISVPRPFLAVADLVLSYSNPSVYDNKSAMDVSETFKIDVDKAVKDKTYHWTSDKDLSIKDVQGTVQLHASLRTLAWDLAFKAHSKASENLDYPSLCEINRFTKALYLLEAVSRRFSRSFSKIHSSGMEDQEVPYKKACLMFFGLLGRSELRHLLLRDQPTAYGPIKPERHEMSIITHDMIRMFSLK
ncbi:hypothetical protein F5Y18DRAFT_430394 [Xylariaceae sp. FL1019]|nr:hypothetical protein F5Y18DRAFT_430394 [Xylariaceae sp. FL1019]